LICLYCSGGEASVAEAKNKGLKEFLCCLWLMVMRIEMGKRMVKTVKNHKIWHKNCLVCLLIFGFLFSILIHNIARFFMFCFFFHKPILLLNAKVLLCFLLVCTSNLSHMVLYIHSYLSCYCYVFYISNYVSRLLIKLLYFYFHVSDVDCTPSLY